MAEAKIHPPSPSRVAEARAAGLAPLPLLTGLAGTLMGLSLAQRQLVPRLWQELGALLREPLQAFAEGDAPHGTQLVRAHLAELGFTLLWLAALVVACVAIAGVLAQGLVFVWPGRARRPFERPKPSYVAAALWCVAMCGLLLLSLRDAFWLEVAFGSHADPSASIPFVTLLTRWWTRATLIALGLSLVDAGFARAQFFRALWLTRREQQDELREAYGSPELRAARAEARHASRGGVAT